MKIKILLVALFVLLSMNLLAKQGDTTVVQCFTFADISPKGWQATYKADFIFPDDDRRWSKILMVKTLKCDSATAADKLPCGEWDYITQTKIFVPKGDTVEAFEIATFVTPYGIRLDLTKDGWEWVKEITDYAPLLKGKKSIQSGNNQELLNLKFIFIEGKAAREVISVENIWSSGSYIYEYLATDSILKAKKMVLNPEATAFKVKARISGHGHNGPRNCCEWDSKTHSYYIGAAGDLGHFRWNVWRNCGDNPIYPQGGTWPFDRAGWCPGTFVDEYDFSLDAYAWPGDTILFDYGIEMFKENGEKKGEFRMAHQLFSYGPIISKYDVEIVDVLSPNNKDRYRRLNQGSPIVTVVIRNNGSVVLKKCTITCRGGKHVRGMQVWTGSLAFGQMDTIQMMIPEVMKLRGGQKFKVEVKKPNGIEDQNIVNNTFHTIVAEIPILPSSFVFSFETNNKERAKETQWFIMNSAGEILIESKEFLQDDSLYLEDITLKKGCYQLLIQDVAEDGMIMHWWLRNSDPDQVGKNGRIQILDKDGKKLHYLPYDFGEFIQFNFKVE